MTTPRLPRCQTPGCNKAANDGDRCRPHALMEDADWLLDAGESPEDVCRRLGVTLGALDVTYRRLGRRDARQRTISAAHQLARKRVEMAA